MNIKQWLVVGSVSVVCWGTLNMYIPEAQARNREKVQEAYAPVVQASIKQDLQRIQSSVPEKVVILASPSEIEEVKEIPLVSMPQEAPQEQKAEVRIYTEAEEALLARLIEAEGGIESYECKLAIGSVVHNRVMSSEFPNSIKEVIWQRKPSVQFAVILKNEKGIRPIESVIPSEDSLRAAHEIALGNSTLPKDILVFYSNYCDAGWVTSRKKFTQIDHTIFAYTFK